MAVHGIIPPKFAPDATSWKDFKEEFHIYLTASGQEKIDDTQKISLLVYQMGSQYVKVFKNELSFANEQDSKKFKTVIEKFDAYFEPKKLLKAHITKFQARKQLPNESITEFITVLRDLAKLCEFKEQEDNMLSVQISNGVSSHSLRKKLWEEDLTLAQILEKCSSFELREASAKLYAEADQKPKDVNAVRYSRGRGSSRARGSRGRSRAPSRGSSHSDRNYDRSHTDRNYGSSQSGFSTQNQAQSSSRGRGGQTNRGRQQHTSNESCERCGRIHAPRRCPAYYKNCRACGARGHFDNMCRSVNRSVNAMTHEFVPNDSYYDDYVETNDVPEYELVSSNFNALNIYAMSLNTNYDDKWSVLLQTPYENGRGCVRMKIDTQAQCNVLSEKSYRRMSQNASAEVVLKPSSSMIRAFGNSCVKPIGKTKFDVVQNNVVSTIECEVVSGDVPNILGAEDSEKLGFIRRVMSATQDKDNKFSQRLTNKAIPKCIVQILEEFADRFPIDEVGQIPGKVSLSLDPDYKDGPKSFPSRPVPAALKEPAKKQLDYLESKGIITKVPIGVPTPWCSQLHVVHKKDGKSVRICIDPKFLNRALLREYHPLRTLEDVLTRTNGSTIFTTLDANMGYFQLQLDDESQLLTAFSTPWGRYMYKRLPMGISSSPEIFQRAMEKILEGMDIVEVIFDDFLLHSQTMEQHSKILRQTLFLPFQLLY